MNVERVRAVVAELDWTFAEFGRRIGCTRTHARDLLLGRAAPSMKLRSRIYDALAPHVEPAAVFFPADDEAA
jgi:transcriptional regulator with XRE-family HTH domain